MNVSMTEALSNGTVNLKFGIGMNNAKCKLFENFKFTHTVKVKFTFTFQT